MRIIVNALLVWISIGFAAYAATDDSPVPDSDILTVRSIQIDRANIFGQIEQEQFFIPRVANKLHVVTRESVIRRQIWFRPGESLTLEDIAELERNLRELDLFALVNVNVTTVDEASDESHPTVDVVISTVDRLSIVFSAGGSFLGGIGEVKFSVGEKNLFGLGHWFEIGYAENTKGELLGSFGYDNVRLFGSDTIAGIRFGQTEEGNFSGIKIRNEFENSNDRLAWQIDIDRENTKVDYYEQGESVVEVPRITEKLALNRYYRKGDRHRFWRYGPFAEYKTIDYSAATGPQADTIEQPADSTELFVGGLIGFDTFRHYRKTTWFDTLSYQQDLSFGFGSELAVGASDTRDESSNRIKPAVFINAWSRNQLSQHEFISSKIKTALVSESGRDDTWSASAAVKLYSTRFDHITLASRIRYASAFNSTGLPVTQSLGEDSGLRGYPAREFNGEQSLSVNLEGRFATPLQILTFRFGAVTFVDAGWVGNRGQDDFLSDVHTSAGVGLRVGSPPILGSSIVRVDLAYPFDDNAERNYQPTLSLSLDQVFAFE